MTNSNILFESVKKSVRELIEKIAKQYATELNVEYIKDLPEVYMVFVYFKSCTAQVVVTESDWAPYRYVYFEVLSMSDKAINPIFTWYDCEKDDINSIIKNLQAGIKYAIDYTPPV